MAEDDQVHGRLPDELAERLGQGPRSDVRHPGSNRRKSLSPQHSRANGVCTSRMRCHGGRGRLLSDLAPFMNLLPAEIILSEMKDQELLRTILVDVGRHAYCHLVKFLNTRAGAIILGTTLNDFIPPPPNQLTTDEMVMLSECLDDAVDSIRDIANHPSFKDTGVLNHASRETIPEEVRDAVRIEAITPEMAATALTLLTASAFRRPPTRMVESMMAASQEAQTNGVDGDSQREGTETLDETVPPPPASDDSLLGLACSTGLWELAMLMVRVRQSGDFMGEAECTPLMEACAAGHEKIVRQMIPYSADLNTQSVTQNTALIYASAAGHLDCVEALLEAGKASGIDLDIKNENGHCALMEAASGGHLEIVKRLIEAGSGSLRMNVNSEFKESPLTLAAYKGHGDLVAYLLTLDLGETREEELHTALMEASMDGHIEVAEILLKEGAPVNLPSDSFESPLTLASCGGHTELVKMLLASGASIEEPNDESYTPIMEAAREGHADVVRLLIEAGACVTAMTEETGETSMTLAACGGFTEIVEMLLEAGGDLEQGANTPLMEAATEGHLHTAAGIIRMMKEHGHDKDVARLPGIIEHVSTALCQAADNGHYQIVREIGTSGFVDLNFQLEGNRTAMMKAAKGGYRDIIRFLVQAGADVNARASTADVTALSLACAGGHYDTVAELLQHNADPNVILKDGVTCVLEAARHGYVHIVELLLDYRGGAGGNSGPKPNRKVATPRRTVTAARKAATAAANAVAPGVLAGTPSVPVVPPPAVAPATKGPPGMAVGVVGPPPGMGLPLLPPVSPAHSNASSCSSYASSAFSTRAVVNAPAHHHHHHHHVHPPPPRGSTSSSCCPPLTPGGSQKLKTAHVHAAHNPAKAAQKQLVQAHVHNPYHPHPNALGIDFHAEAPPPCALPHSGNAPCCAPKSRTASSSSTQTTATATITATVGGVVKKAACVAVKATSSSQHTGEQHSITRTTSDMPPGLCAALLAEKLRTIPAEAQDRLMRGLELTGGDAQDALVRQFLSDETIVQRLAAGDTVSLNTKTGETSAGVQLDPLLKNARDLGGGMYEMAVGPHGGGDGPRVRGSLAQLRKMKKEAAEYENQRAKAADGVQRATAEADAISAVREQFMASVAADHARETRAAMAEVAQAQVAAAQTAFTKAASAMQHARGDNPAAAASVAATNSPSKTAAAARAKNVIDPGAQASEMMKHMANQLTMPTKDQPLTDSQVESFHRFHNFLVRTAKGENPPTPTFPGSMGASQVAEAMAAAARNGAQVTMDSDAMRFTIKVGGDETHVHMKATGGPAPSDAAAVAALMAAHATMPPGVSAGVAFRSTLPSTGGGLVIPPGTTCKAYRAKPPPPPSASILAAATGAPDHTHTLLGGPWPTAVTAAAEAMREASASPSPCPSSPASSIYTAQPLMTASSDEFVSDQRVPVQVKRRSASVPHNHTNARWPQDTMLHSHKECMVKKPVPGSAAAKGEAVPPPAKRATGANRQGACRPGTVEKRPLAATSTFDVDMQTESNNDTPLTLACSNGHTAMVELLVQRGANVHHRDKKGFTPLILAATGGHLKIVETLLGHGANIETTSERTKDTALSLACSGGKKDVADMLLKKGANKEHRNVSDYTPLSLAASGGYVDICNMLLDAGAEINSRTGSKLGISPLMLAAMNGHKDATRVLLERGSDINAQIETNRNTALTLACFQGRTEVVRLLLQYNANVEHRAKTGLTPLMEAANGGYVEVGQLLLEAYADPNTSPVPSSRDTALTIAADKGHEKFVELLLKNGAAVDARNKKGCTALWLACHGGHLETVQTLVKHKKTNVEMEDNRKVSPLMVAFRKGHTKIVKYLVKWVAQFPGDAELCRYIQTVTEQDLMTRCHECMNVIVTAKDKQAAQANLAADALIAQIEAEEEQARSKKLSKQRQKEKKKAKKQEKKKEEEVVKKDESEYEDDDVDIDVVTVEIPEMPKEEPKKAVEAVKPAESKTKPGKSTPLAAKAAGKARAAAALAAAAAVRAPAETATSTATTPEREKAEKAEERIPGLNLPPAPVTPTPAPAAEEPAAAARKTAADRRASRRNRNESGKNATAAAAAMPTTHTAAPVVVSTPAPTPRAPTPVAAPSPVHTSPPAVITTSSPVHQPRVTVQQQQQQQQAYQQYTSLLSPLASPRGVTEEWVKPTKKGRNAREKTSTDATPSARSSSATEKPKLITDPTEEGSLAMWNNIEASRRRMATLTVSSPCIARVIGRGGANINAIREATGASIEVERQVDKALARRDNIDREICIRGTAETVKNAVAMINGLIAETDVTVNEIIRLVRNSASPSDQARIVPDTYTHHTTKMAAATATSAMSTAGRAAAAATSTGNVWQQRMAARQAQDALRPAPPPVAPAAASAAAMAAAAAAVQLPPSAHSPAPTTTSDGSSPAVTRASTPPREQQQYHHEENNQEESIDDETNVPSSPAPISSQSSAPARPISSLLTEADHAQLHELQQRKAPGFARPACVPVVTPAAAAMAFETLPSTPTPEPTRPTALPSTPLHDHSRVPDLSQHVMSFGGGRQEEEQVTTGRAPSPPPLAKHDSASALFNDTTYKSIADIWGDTTTELASSTRSSAGAFGGAWDNALLLNSFNNISLSKPDWSDYSAPSSTMDPTASAFSSMPSASHHHLHQQHQQHHQQHHLGHHQSMPSSLHQQQHQQHSTMSAPVAAAAAAGYGMPAADPFAANGPRSGPLFARGANAASAARAAPSVQMKQQQQQQQQQQSTPLDSIFTNVAAALLHHQTGVTTSTTTMPSSTMTSSAAANSYYPSPSYTDPASMGLGLGLKAYGGNGAVAAAYQQQQQNAFGRTMQSAQQQQQQATAAAVSQAAAMQARMATANGYPPPPPPGFNQLNSVVPPPSLAARSAAAAAYFGGQMAPPPGTAAAAAGGASPFHLYAQNGWSSNGLPQKPAAPPTMNGTSNGRGGASSFYSNGWN